MKLIVSKAVLLGVTTLLLSISSMPLVAQVYKTIDENGNVVFTDRQPDENARPIQLREISVIESPVYEQPASAVEDENGGQGTSLRFLRRNYKDFAIVAPLSEESVWHPESPVTVSWGTHYQLQEGMTVTITVDGEVQERTTQRTITLGKLDRGEHTINAVLSDAGNRRIATAEAVTFYIRQPNIYSNRARPAPRG